MKALFSFYSDALKIALQSIFAHKLRAFLTLIGIIIGVASVVVVGASISGLNTYVVDKMSKVLGSNHFMMARMASHGRLSDDEYERMNRRNKRINWDDYEWVRDHCRSCAEVGAQVGGNADLRQDGVEFPGAMSSLVMEHEAAWPGASVNVLPFSEPEPVQFQPLAA